MVNHKPGQEVNGDMSVATSDVILVQRQMYM